MKSERVKGTSNRGKMGMEEQEEKGVVGEHKQDGRRLETREKWREGGEREIQAQSDRE